MYMGVIIFIMLSLGLILGPIISIIVTPIFCLLRKIFYVPFIRKNLLNKAIQMGHVVTARLIKSYDIIADHGDYGFTASGKEIGVYTYEYNGRTYKYRAVTTARLPNELTLYFVRKPGKACTDDEIGMRESSWIKYYLIISIVLVPVIFAFGMYYASNIL